MPRFQSDSDVRRLGEAAGVLERQVQPHPKDCRAVVLKDELDGDELVSSFDPEKEKEITPINEGMIKKAHRTYQFLLRDASEPDVRKCATTDF